MVPGVKSRLLQIGGTFKSRSCSTGPAHYDNQNQSRANYRSQKRAEEREEELNSNSKKDEKDPKKFQSDTVFFSASSLQ